MIIDEAIRILSTDIDKPIPGKNYLFNEALKLGIEALKQIQKYRPAFDGQHPPLLPGETED